jgi:hypothetical protein
MKNLKIFDEIKSNIQENKNLLMNILLQEAKDYLKGRYSRSKNNLFIQRKYDIKYIFKAYKDIWWEFFKHTSSTLKGKYSIYDKQINKTLEKNGIAVMSSYFKKEFIRESKTIIFDEIKRRDNFLNNKNIYDNTNSIWIDDTSNSGRIYNRHSKYEGRDRVWFTDPNKSPDLIRELFHNKDFIEICSSYSGCKCYPDAIVGEYVYAPVIPRNDYFWHVDVLKDQFKIMIALCDVEENGGEFIYIPKTHILDDKYKDKYHNMYRVKGIECHDYLEDNIVDSKKQKKAFLKAGDVAFFDTMIHHTWSYPKENKSRLNLVVYFQMNRTSKNMLFGAIE